MAEIADDFLNASTDMAVVHRRVVRVGAAAAWFAATMFLGIGLFAGNPELIVQTIAPVLIGAFMTAQFLLDREDAYIGLTAAALVIVVFYSVIGTSDTIIPASVGLVIICALATVFVESRVVTAVVIIGVSLFLVPLLWGLTLGQSVVLGAALSLSFVTASVIFISVRSALAQLRTRFQMLFELSPTAVMEEDWSEAIEYVRSEYTGRPDRIRPFLLAYPAVVGRAVSRARITKVNRAAVALFGARDDEELLGLRSGDKVNEENNEVFVDALVALYEGRTEFDSDVRTQTLDGRSIWLQARAVDTSTEGGASRIIIAMADITHIRERNETMTNLILSLIHI